MSNDPNASNVTPITGHWQPGDPGPNGKTRADGMWPCQCFTCSACTNPSVLRADFVAAKWKSGAEKIMCVACSKDDAHQPQASRPTEKWIAPKTWSPEGVIDDEERAWQAARDRTATEETRRRLLADNIRYWDEGIGRRFQASQIDGFVDPGALGDINAFKTNVRSPNRARGINLVLLGPLGGGKTYLLHAITRDLVVDGTIAPQGIRFGTETQLLHPLTTGLPTERKARLDAMTDPKRVTMFVIDEVGRSNWVSEDDQRWAWDVIVDFAYQNDIPVLIATNLAPSKADQVRNAAQQHPRAGASSIRKAQAVDTTERVSPVARIAQPGGGGVAAATGLLLNEYLGDAAYDRLKHNTPRDVLTPVLADNRRLGVKEGDIPRYDQGIAESAAVGQLGPA